MAQYFMKEAQSNITIVTHRVCLSLTHLGEELVGAVGRDEREAALVVYVGAELALHGLLAIDGGVAEAALEEVHHPQRVVHVLGQLIANKRWTQAFIHSFIHRSPLIRDYVEQNGKQGKEIKLKSDFVRRNESDL